MKKEMDSQRRKLSLIARHYGKGRLASKCISCCALLIQVFNWWWNNEVSGRTIKGDEKDQLLTTLSEQIAWAQVSTVALAELFGISEQVDTEREAVLTELLEKAKQEIIHEKSGK